MKSNSRYVFSFDFLIFQLFLDDTIASMREREISPHAMRQQRIHNFVAGTSFQYGLEDLQREALGKFAHINYRIRQVKRDFSGTIYREVRYSAGPGRAVLARADYQTFLTIASATAFNLYNEYLSKSEAERTAAREVQIFVNDLFPNP